MNLPLDRYLSMLTDRTRLDAYARAIARVVKPGDTVIDLGSGLGTFAVLAAKRGAQRVFAVEKQSIGHFVTDLARGNGTSDRIEFFKGTSSEFHPTERARVCIFDDFSVIDVSGATSQTLSDARDRLLLPNGVFLPHSIEVCLAAAEAPLHPSRSLPTPLATGAEPLDFSALNPVYRSLTWAARIPANQIVSTARVVATLPCASFDTTPLDGAVTVIARKRAVIHGIACWIRLQLCRGISLDTGPAHSDSVYPHIFFPIEPLRVAKGGRVRIRLRRIERMARDGQHVFFDWSAHTRFGEARSSNFGSLTLESVNKARAAR
ncbi:MAG: hypothetical protein NVSMB1_18120 [Polyangiales bacterium]